jgi:Domain of unknown function (DUF1906)
VNIPHRGRIAVGLATVGAVGLAFVLVPGLSGSVGTEPGSPVAHAANAPGFTVHLNSAATGGGTGTGGHPGGNAVGGGSVGNGAGAGSGTATIDYLGHAFTVPASWRIVDLAKNPADCVRFDTNAVYLGTPGTQADCPATGIGQSTEAMLIQPSAAGAASSVVDTTSRQISTVAQGVRVTATYATHESQVAGVIAAAGLPKPVASARVSAAAPVVGSSPGAGQSPTATPSPTSTATPPPPAAVPGVGLMTRSYIGLGFDACTAPSTATMTDWAASPYKAVGVYIGGADRICAQPNLSSGWVSAEASAGWHLLPIYAGPQAIVAGDITSPAVQGAAAADDAVAQAESLGIGTGAVLYYDMEVASSAYTAAQTATSTAFLGAWTIELHTLGYFSGVYGNEGGSVGAQVAGWGTVVEPDVLDVGNWNSLSDDDPGADPGSDWTGRRVHQFAGDVNQTYGGMTIQVDEDYFDLANVTCPAGPGSGTAPASASASASASPSGAGAARSDALLCNGFAVP